MRSISDLIFSKLISFEPNINPVPREKIIDFFTKEQRFIREDHIKFLMEYGGEPSPICFDETYIDCSFKEIKELIEDEKEYGREIPNDFLYFGNPVAGSQIIINDNNGALYRLGKHSIGQEVCGNIKTFTWIASLSYIEKISLKSLTKSDLTDDQIHVFLKLNNNYLLSDLISPDMQYYFKNDTMYSVSIKGNYIISHKIKPEIVEYINVNMMRN